MEDLQVKVRTTEGSEVEVNISSSGSVGELKHLIAQKLNLGDKNIRLIFSGKLLDPPNSLLSEFKLKSGSFVHAVASNKIVQDASENYQQLSQPSLPDLSNLRGLDVLMQSHQGRSPLSIEDVASLRSYFRDDIAEFVNDNRLQREGLETEQEFVYRCESLWMENQGPHSEFRLNLYGRSLSWQAPNLRLLNFTNAIIQRDDSRSSDPETGTDYGSLRDFIYGFIMGFIFGFMMIFCVWDRNVTHKQKIGLLAGILVNMIYSILLGNQHHTSYSKNKQQQLHNQQYDTSNTIAVTPVITSDIIGSEVGISEISR